MSSQTVDRIILALKELPSQFLCRLIRRVFFSRITENVEDISLQELDSMQNKKSLAQPLFESRTLVPMFFSCRGLGQALVFGVILMVKTLFALFYPLRRLALALIVGLDRDRCLRGRTFPSESCCLLGLLQLPAFDIVFGQSVSYLIQKLVDVLFGGVERPQGILVVIIHRIVLLLQLSPSDEQLDLEVVSWISNRRGT